MSLLTFRQIHRLRNAEQFAAQAQLHADIKAALADIGASVVRINGAPHIVRDGAKLPVAFLAAQKD